MIITISGNYSVDYNRTHIILQGLQTIPNITIIHAPFKKKADTKKPHFIEALEKADIIYMPSFTHNEVPKIQKLTSKPIVFDPLISRYITKVFDYKLVHKYSIRALKNYLKDKRALRAADGIIADTEAHKQFFMQQFNIPEQKIHVLPIGVHTPDFTPTESSPNSVFTVGFYGGFIPLQGVTNIIETARILHTNPQIRFELVGNGFEYEKMQQLSEKYGLTNLSFTGWVPYETLAETINSWDICLGIFGETMKADIVIPNKIYHYAALKKAIITKATPAISELFTHNTSIITCAAKPEEIAKHIIDLQNNSEKREYIAEQAYNLITQSYNEKKIAESFVSILSQYI